jgi:hypothetical protein
MYTRMQRQVEEEGSTPGAQGWSRGKRQPRKQTSAYFPADTNAFGKTFGMDAAVRPEQEAQLSPFPRSRVGAREWGWVGVRGMRERMVERGGGRG